MNTLLRSVGAEFLNALSPVRLFNMEQARKLGADLAHTAMPGMRRAGMQGATESLNKAGAFMRSTSMGDLFSAWWGGHYFDKVMDATMHPRFGRQSAEAFAAMGANRAFGPRGVPGGTQRFGNLYSRVAERNATIRRSTAGVLGAATIGTMVLGRDHIIPDIGNMGISTAAAVGPAAAMFEHGARTGSGLMKSMGYGWLGLSAWNAVRGGDNWGPF